MKTEELCKIAHPANITAVRRYNTGMLNNHDEEARILGFGAALRYYRDQAGIKQQTLADMLGVSQTRLSRWEAQIGPPRNVYVLTRLAHILQVDVEDLKAGRIRKEVAPIDDEDTDDPIKQLIREIARDYSGRMAPDEIAIGEEILKGYYALGDEERRHVRNQIQLLLRVRSPHPHNRPVNPPDNSHDHPGGFGTGGA